MSQKLGRRATFGLMGAAALVGLLACNPPPPGGGHTLDQSQEQVSTCGGGGGGTSLRLAQTFTTGITGDLDQVDIAIARSGGVEDPAEPFVVEIRSVSGGEPTDTVLASASVPAGSVPLSDPAFVPVPIGPVPVSAGTQYAIVLARTGAGFGWCGGAPDSYAGGAFLWEVFPGFWGEFGPMDLGFRTYVTVPPAP
jgi:hypothetical protein